MLKRTFASRGFLSVATILVLAAVAVVGYRIAKPTPEMRSYCALMPDGIGLFEGSDVTVLGLRVGRVTRVEPSGDGARVDFEIPAAESLSVEVGATTLSDTLVADRTLALIGTAADGAPAWDHERCITRTLTPKSLTATFNALAGLADELNGGEQPERPDLIKDGIAALDTATAGHGQQINDIVRKLGAALNSPDAAIGHLGGLIDALADLAHSAANGWGDVKDMLTRLTAALQAANDQVVPPIVDVVEGLRDVLPAANEAIVTLGGPVLRRLDAAADNLPLLLAGIGTLRELIAQIPPLTQAFSTAVDPATGRTAITYAPPAVALPDAAAAEVCAAINALAAGRCTDASGLAQVQVTQLVLGSAGAR
ncbi:virulence factor Mce-like protein [Nocardia tenerifensis]|uniref:Virulence factor Mce-like protein n=1 Tax=Nocardia tenerifensis TaxID=228006 RepID=A0A318JWJ8_9NOCA|nr:MlaD family protein [Nocardia tenerifensis]PXX58457.1 virulence factor Mce-like protein [Nocardia tenerifensis]